MLVGLSAHARYRAAPPGDHARRVLRHDGADRRHGDSDPQGLFPDPGHRPDLRRGGSGAGRLARGNDAPAARARRGHPARSRRRGVSSRPADGGTAMRRPPNTARFIIVLKPRDERSADGLADHRPAAAAIGARSQGASLSMQPAQDITVGGRTPAGSSSTRCRDADIAELTEWSQKMLERCGRCRKSPMRRRDLLANAPQIRVAINRDQASRFGISPQTDRRHAQRRLTASGRSRSISRSSTPTGSFSRSRRELQGNLASLDRLYVKSPLTGAAVPLSALVTSILTKVGPLSVTHQDQFPAVTLSFNLRAGRRARPGRRCDRQAAREIGMPAR